MHQVKNKCEPVMGSNPVPRIWGDSLTCQYTIWRELPVWRDVKLECMNVCLTLQVDMKEGKTQQALLCQHQHSSLEDHWQLSFQQLVRSSGQTDIKLLHEIISQCILDTWRREQYHVKAKSHSVKLNNQEWVYMQWFSTNRLHAVMFNLKVGSFLLHLFN